MYSYFIPSEFVRSVFHITPEFLKDKGIKGIITDLDNTLVEWDRPDATPKLIEWFKGMKEAGIQVTIVSNNNEMRVQSFADPLGIPFIFKARKPLGKAFRQALQNYVCKKSRSCCYWRSVVNRCIRRKPTKTSYHISNSSCKIRWFCNEV